MSLLLPSAPMFGRGAFVTDFRETPIGSGPPGWTERWDTGISANGSSNAAALGGRVISPLGTATGAGHLTLDAAGAAQTDGEVLAIINTGASTTAPIANPAILIRGGSSATEGYKVVLERFSSINSGALTVNIGALGVSNNATNFTWAANTKYAMRVRFQGTTISVKVWAYPGTEPGTNTASLTNSAYSSGRVGFHFNDTDFYSAQGTVEYFAFQPGSGVAPLPQG